MGGNFNPNAEAENQGIGLANFPSDYSLPLQYSQGATGSLRLRQLFSGPPLGIEPGPIRH